MTMLSGMSSSAILAAGSACRQLQGASSVCRIEDVPAQWSCRYRYMCQSDASLQQCCPHSWNLTCWLWCQSTRRLSWQHRVRHTACTNGNIRCVLQGLIVISLRCPCVPRRAKCAPVRRRHLAELQRPAYSRGRWRPGRACWRAGRSQRCLGMCAFGPLAGGPDLQPHRSASFIFGRLQEG